MMQLHMYPKLFHIELILKGNEAQSVHLEEEVQDQLKFRLEHDQDQNLALSL